MSLEIKQSIDNLLQTFEEFKQVNDARLVEIEKKGNADPLIDDKLKKLDDTIQKLQSNIESIEDGLKKSNRFFNQDVDNSATSDYKKSFLGWAKKGLHTETQMQQLEAKTYSELTLGSGGVLVPIEMSNTIQSRVSELSPFRSLAAGITISSGAYEEPWDMNDMSAGWIGKGSSRPTTTTGTFKNLRIEPQEVYASPRVLQTLLDDSFINLETYLTEKFSEKFAQLEVGSDGFVSGDGVNCPLGFLSPTKVSTDDATRTWNNIQYVATGASGDFASSNKADIFIDLLSKFKDGMLEAGNVAWVMRGTTEAAIRKLKDSAGQYLWNPTQMMDGGRPLLYGYPVVKMTAMPAIGANSYSVALANWSRAYLIVDRLGIRVLRDPYTTRGSVEFYATARVGGGVRDYDALKLIKFGTS